MGISFDFKFFLSEIGVAFTYIPIVALLTIVPLTVGTLIGGGLALSRVYKLRIIQSAARVYVIITRSIPILLQMLLMYFVIKGFYDYFGLNAAHLNKMVTVLISCTIISAGFLSEGIRAALLSVESGQYEAAYSVGMTRMQSARYVIFPQSLPVAIPIFGSISIGVMKASSAAYLLGVVELIQGTAMKTAGNYKYLEAYCAAAVIYWALTLGIERVIAFCEKRVRIKMRGGVS
ncbi:MAG: amino acid ABC transporter permease [Clostridiales bacterium]|jgi:L-cystine transport system permease protein|nr:amino acid ABC transporter permease [Clostridiales bacterium]